MMNIEGEEMVTVTGLTEALNRIAESVEYLKTIAVSIDYLADIVDERFPE